MLQQYVVEQDLVSSEQHVAALREVLALLPSTHYAVAREVFRILALVAEQEDKNRMSPSNIAIVFGPLLLRPRVESFASTLNIVGVSQVIKALIEHREEIFSQEQPIARNKQ